MIADDDLKLLHKYQDFQHMVQLCKEREEKAKTSTKPDLKIVGLDRPSLHREEPRALVMALHGNQENIEITEPYW